MKPEEPFTVTLTAVEWNGVLDAMGYAQYRVVSVLFDRIRQQIAEQDPAAFGMPAMNGTGHPLPQ